MSERFDPKEPEELFFSDEASAALGLSAVEAAFIERVEQEPDSQLAAATTQLRTSVENVRQYQQAVEGASKSHIAERLLETVSLSNAEAAVAGGQYSDSELENFMAEINAIKSYGDSLLENNRGELKELSYMPLKMLEKVPNLAFRFAYFSQIRGELGEVHKTLAEAVRPEKGRRSVEMAASLISKAYARQSLDSITGEQAQLDDRLVKSLLRHPEFYNLQIQQLKSEPAEGQTDAECTEEAYAQAEKFLAGKMALPQDLRNEFLAAVWYRSKKFIEKDGDNSIRDVTDLREALFKAKENIEELGAEEIMNLREVCGIVNLDGYTPAQLQRMTRVNESDPAAIEHIQAGDSTIYLTDAKGDHNGAYGGGQKWEGESGRALFFEITRPSDFYRHMLFLQKRGIKPSTVIVNAHGQPGKMGFGDEAEKRFRVGTESAGADYLLAEAGGIKRLAEDFMQDSRGIDDDEASIGRKKLLLLSCSQAHLTSSLDVGEDGNFKTQLHKSTADTIAQTANVPNLDIYAPQRPVGIQESADETGLIFLENAQSKNQVPASKITCQTDGKITTTFVDEIPLRRK